jgi:hypothetical protein
VVPPTSGLIWDAHKNLISFLPKELRSMYDDPACADIEKLLENRLLCFGKNCVCLKRCLESDSHAVVRGD